KEKDFDLTDIDPKKASIEFDQAHKANTYITELLKLAYIQLYLEIQNAFSIWIEDKLVIEDLSTQLLLEPVPQKPLLTEIQSIELAATEKLLPRPEPKPQHVPYTAFPYHPANTNPEKVSDLCSRLKFNNTISQAT